MNKVLKENDSKNIAELSDDFAIKNFVLKDASEVMHNQSLENPLIFNGLVFGVCLKGNMKFNVNYKICEVAENDIFTILPNHIFKVIQFSTDLIIETLFLSFDYILQLPLPKNFDLLKKIAACPKQTVKREDIHDMLEIHALISKHHNNKENPYADKMTSGFIYALLMEVAYLYKIYPVGIMAPLSRQEVLTEKFFEVLSRHYIKERSVAFYAEKLCLTPKYLSMTVKKVTGYPITNWMNEVVIIEAKRRLKMTDSTVLQISEELNFPNPSFFGRFFKQYAGMTPLAYRNS